MPVTVPLPGSLHYNTNHGVYMQRMDVINGRLICILRSNCFAGAFSRSL